MRICLESLFSKLLLNTICLTKEHFSKYIQRRVALNQSYRANGINVHLTNSGLVNGCWTYNWPPLCKLWPLYGPWCRGILDPPLIHIMSWAFTTQWSRWAEVGGSSSSGSTSSCNQFAIHKWMHADFRCGLSAFLKPRMVFSICKLCLSNIWDKFLNEMLHDLISCFTIAFCSFCIVASKQQRQIFSCFV